MSLHWIFDSFCPITTQFYTCKYDVPNEHIHVFMFVRNNNFFPTEFHPFRCKVPPLLSEQLLISILFNVKFNSICLLVQKKLINIHFKHKSHPFFLINNRFKMPMPYNIKKKYIMYNSLFFLNVLSWVIYRTFPLVSK